MNYNRINRKEIALRMNEMELNNANKGRVFYAIDIGSNVVEIESMILRLYYEQNETESRSIQLLDNPIHPVVIGESIIDSNAIDDINAICRLPYVVWAGIMPDGHRVKDGHVPVGGVVATRDCILPGVVGSDIACSVRLTITNNPVDSDWITNNLPALSFVLQKYSYFGLEMNPNPVWEYDLYNEVCSDEVYRQLDEQLVNPISKKLLTTLKATARNHFGTSGDGNHFVDLGIAQIGNETNFAIMSHFGSRGIGAKIADFFLDKANELYPMPKGYNDNAPLFFNADGWANDYFVLMNWAGKFAQNSHEHLHYVLMTEIANRVDFDTDVLRSVYSRHNFCWMFNSTDYPELDGVYIHRKGATPANYNEWGIIPATMGDQSQIVVGKGNEQTLFSASHGAGRVMSRGTALKQLKGETKEYVAKEYGVSLIGGDKDEDPRAYKRISDVMKYQSDAVSVVGAFTPYIVRMAEPRFKF